MIERSIQPPSDESPQKHRELRIQLPSRKVLLIASFAIAILVAGAGGTFVWWQQAHAVPNPFRSANLKPVNFTLLYPRTLPPQYHIDQSSVIQPERGAVTFTVVAAGKGSIFISEVPWAETYDFEGLFHQFSELKKEDLGGSILVSGHMQHGQQSIASRVVKQTWLIATSDKTVQPATLADVLRTLNTGLQQP